MYHKVLVPYDMSDPAQHALVAALELVADVPDAQVTVLNVVDWQDYNAETFKIASRMSGVLGDSLDMDAIAGVGEEAAKQTTERVSADIAEVLDGIGSTLQETNVFNIAVVNGSPPMPTKAIMTASSWGIVDWAWCAACWAAYAIRCCTRRTSPC